MVRRDRGTKRCQCGRRMRVDARACWHCHREERLRQLAAAQAVVQRGVCPVCGRTLRRNGALAGWWQCEQFGAVGYRADPATAECSFQTFTE
jgi:hypothetical protein